jgi:hypothetical protein
MGASIVRKAMPIVAIACSVFEPAYAEPNQYLCIVEQVAGVHFSGKARSWVPQVYAPGRKFVLRRLKGDERVGKYPDTNPQGYTFNRAQEIEKDKSEGFFPSAR